MLQTPDELANPFDDDNDEDIFDDALPSPPDLDLSSLPPPPPPPGDNEHSRLADGGYGYTLHTAAGGARVLFTLFTSVLLQKS